MAILMPVLLLRTRSSHSARHKNVPSVAGELGFAHEGGGEGSIYTQIGCNHYKLGKYMLCSVRVEIFLKSVGIILKSIAVLIR